MSSTDTPDTPETPEPVMSDQPETAETPEPVMSDQPETPEPESFEPVEAAAETETPEPTEAAEAEVEREAVEADELAADEAVEADAAVDDVEAVEADEGEDDVEAEPAAAGVAAGGTPLTQTTGRRKESIARLRLRPGTGQITVNDRPFEQYFATAAHRMEAIEPLRVLEGADERYDVEVTISGGGARGQAGAMRMALARSLAAYEPEHRVDLKQAGLLTRDPRRKESKKYGLVKARKAKQFTKR